MSVEHACSAAAEAIGAFGAGLSLARGGTLREPVLATDPRSEELTDMQTTLGEGPGIDALNGEGAVLIADLAAPECGRRWPAFAPAATTLGVHGVFAIPVRVGQAQLGVLDLYRGRPGPLTGDELADVLGCVDVVLMLALDQRAGIGQPHAGFGDGDFAERRAVVHQAAGMVSVQLDITVTEALARLRGYAYAQERRLGEIAAEVVARSLWFGASTDGAGSKEEPG